MENLIAFPALGFEFTLNRVALTVLGQDLYWYGIIIGAGFLLALLYGNSRVKDFGLTSDNLYDTVIWALPAAIVCARLYYVAFEWEYYAAHPSEIIAIWNGGLAIYGGVIGALIAVCICGKIYKLNIAPMFDIAGLGLLIGQLIGRWGNFMNGEAHGGITDSVFGMLVNGEGPFHPTFFYESMWNLVGFLALHFISKHAYKFKGEIFLLYLIWYGAGRGWIEGLRTDSLYIGSTGLRASQILAWVTCIGAFVVFMACQKKQVTTIQQLWNQHADARTQYGESASDAIQ